jgi:deazaflavin-dependent oxidoreductase (nitroreductase family)
MKPTDKNENLGNVILLLTTTGRKTRQPMVSALQYEDFKGEHCISVPRGSNADWFRNILADPWVDAHVKGRKYHALAEPVTDAIRIADFLVHSLVKHSSAVVSMVRMHGLPPKPTRAQLEALSATLVVVFLHPAKE